MTPLGWWFGVGCLFFGAFLGVLVVALCVAAKNGDEDAPEPLVNEAEWTFDPNSYTLSNLDRVSAIVCGPGSNPRDRRWLGEAMADALNQAHVPVVLTGPASIVLPCVREAVRK